ncbi:MAG: FAD-dependent oxidoreductase, partial [Desulfatiglandales bacterium]
MVQKEAARCLKCGICSECYQCVKACLAGAVNHEDRDEILEINTGAIIFAPGFESFDPSRLSPYGYKRLKNVVTSLEFERILSASGPYQGHLIRPFDHKEPKKIAWLQCVGSRDINRATHSYCSSVCCMYAIKQAVIAKEHAKDYDLDTSIFYMDMRTYGKDFERYYERAQKEKGIKFYRCRAHSLEEDKDFNVVVRYTDENGSLEEETFDMVVLSVGMEAPDSVVRLCSKIGVDLNEHNFLKTGSLIPVATKIPGIYACGAFVEPKDIPSSVMEASSAASLAGALLAEVRGTLTQEKPLPPERDVRGEEPRIGVFVCNCGINIGGVAKVSEVVEYAKGLPFVVHAEENLFTCSQDTQERIKETIKEKSINRVVVASCSPRTHEPLFQETIKEAGLNPYLFEMANIRDQGTWVHMTEPEKATEKAKDLVRMAVSKALFLEPLYKVDLPVKKAALVVGGGLAGLEAALGFAQNNIKTYLVESTSTLGGIAKRLKKTWDGKDIREYVEGLEKEVLSHPMIEVFMESEVVSTGGIPGDFRSTIKLKKNGEERLISHGVTVLSTGGYEYRPKEFSYGNSPRILTHLEFDALLDSPNGLQEAGDVVFIQCVGSRNEEFPYCSKVCCTHTVKTAVEIKSLDPKRRVIVLYRDMRTYGLREDLFMKARKLGVIFTRFDIDSPPQVRVEGERVIVEFKDHILGTDLVLNPAYVVLAAGIRPNHNKELFETFKVPVNADGYLVEAHPKLRPVDFASDGIYMAGLAHYPKPVEESIAQARAAVSRAMTILSKDLITVGGVVAEVFDPTRCARCLTCVRSCPYGVPYIKDGHAHIDKALCHGCGVCAAECPAKIITLKHFTDEQLLAKTVALTARL